MSRKRNPAPKKTTRNGRAKDPEKDFDIWLRLTRKNQLPQGCSPTEKRAALEMFAEMHGVKPIDNPAQMKASFWPADESTEKMLAAFRAIRQRKAQV
jgi:hypothetical protein